jgi:hypothetical protein
MKPKQILGSFLFTNILYDFGDAMCFFYVAPLLMELKEIM